MAVEIERKFLVDIEKFNALSDKVESQLIKQGYIETASKAVVRVRVKGEEAFLTVKGETKGLSRLEFEYPIPMKDADAMLSELCGGKTIEKRRHFIKFDGLLWEVDVFFGRHQGLVLAEVELDSEEQSVVLPEWVGEEVSYDVRYFNSNLIND